MARTEAARSRSKESVGGPEEEGSTPALRQALELIRKQYGSGAIMRLGDQERIRTEVIQTGALSLDLALGVGGLPRGRVVEVFGPESSGKTTLALSVIANAQRAGGVAAFIDAEHALDPSWAETLGVKLAELLVSQPDSGEQALEIAETLVRSNSVDVIVVDSVAALVPRAELEGDIGDTHMGLQARLMSQAMRKLSGVIAKSRTCMLFINQLRMKIGVMFGNPETTPGGRALKFYASVRIDIRRVGGIKEGDRDIGSVVRCKVAKNKLAPPFKKAEFEILYDRGISREGTILDLALAHRLLEKNGTWYSFDGQKIGPGREKARAYLEEHADAAAQLEAAVRRAAAAAETNTNKGSDPS